MKTIRMHLQCFDFGHIDVEVLNSQQNLSAIESVPCRTLRGCISQETLTATNFKAQNLEPLTYFEIIILCI